MSRGVLYTVTGISRYTGESYLSLAIRSAQSIKKFLPQIAIAVMTDEEYIQQAREVKCFDKVILKKTELLGKYQMKVDWIKHTPFEETLYLDADTLAIHNMQDIFDILKYFDIALPRASFRKKASPLSDLSSSMILFKNTPEIRQIFSMWRSEYLLALEKNMDAGDQGVLTKCIYQSTARCYVIPGEYHFNTGLPCVAHGPVRLVTAHKKNYLEISQRYLNKSLSHRAYFPLLSTIYVDNADQTLSGLPRQSQKISFKD